MSRMPAADFAVIALSIDIRLALDSALSIHEIIRATESLPSGDRLPDAKTRLDLDVAVRGQPEHVEAPAMHSVRARAIMSDCGLSPQFQSRMIRRLDALILRSQDLNFCGTTGRYISILRC
jgi:hypothetical protein